MTTILSFCFSEITGLLNEDPELSPGDLEPSDVKIVDTYLVNGFFCRQSVAEYIPHLITAALYMDH